MWNRSTGWRVGICASLALIAAAGAQEVAAEMPGVEGVAGPGENPPKGPVMPLSARLGVTLPAVMPTEELPVLDLVPLMGQLDGPVGEPVREGIERAMPFFDLGMGAWLEVPEASGGGWLWVLDIHLPGAFGVKPHFTNFALPEGAEVLVYDPQIPDNLPSPYRGSGPKGLGDFWGWTCWSDRSRVEVYVPPSVGEGRFDLSFTIDKVAHIYRSPVTGNIGYFNTREFPCHLDRTCYSNWWQVGDSVGRMQFPTTPGFIGFCSGSMLNQTGDLAPFFLTARHCMQDISSRLDNLEVYWFYQSSTCNGAPPSIGSVPRSVGSSYVLTTPVNDMSLVMIDGTVPRNLWWSGTAFIDHVPEDWNIVGIHHPAGTYKRISFGNIWDEFDSCGATNMSQGAEIDWDAGIIEPGSSGSPMFLLDGRVVGVLSCNELPHGCDQDSSFYGRWGSYVSDYPNVMNASAWDDSSENNDSCGAATNLDIYSNGTLYSRVVKVNDEDWYRITVPPFGTVNFHTNFAHADGDIDMRIHDACGGVLASSTGTTDNENISWTNPNNFARDIRLRVFLYNDTRNIYYLDFSRYGVSAPGNDTCSSPTPVTVGNDYFGTTFAANANGAASCGSSNASPDVYYTIVPSCSQDIVIDTFGSAFDTVLSVTYIVCGSADPWVEFDCNDDAAGTYQSQVSFPGTAGTTYYIRVSGYNGAYGTFNLHVRGVASAYDSCASAPYLDSNGGTAMWSNCTATTDGPPDDICLAFGSNQIYRDIWYTFVAPCAGTIDLNTFGSNFDTKIAVYANPDNSYCPPGPNSALVCNDDVNSALESQVIFNTVPGQRYMYRVGSYSATATTNQGRLTATFTPNCGPVCDSIDFNADGLFPDTLDIDDFLSVFSGGPCSNDPNCADIDFNNDGLFPDTLDIDSLLSVFSGGPCI